MKSLTFQQHLTRHLILGIVIVNVIIYAVAAFHLYQSHRFYEQQTEISTQNLAQTLETNISGILEQLNVALFAVTSEAERQIASGTLDGNTLNAFMARQLKVVPAFEALWIANSRGLIDYGTQLPVGAPVDIADREYFIRQSLRPDLGMVISKPVMGRITRDWSVLISRRINNPDGSFGGIALGSIAVVKYFSHMFAPIDIGSHGLISLRDDELASIVRKPSAQDESGQIGSKLVSTESIERIHANPLTGTYVTRVRLDQIERTMTYRKISTYPWYIFVGRSPRDYLTPWRREAAILLPLLGLFSLVTIFSARLFVRRANEAIAAKQMEARNELLEQRLIERKQAEISLAESEERFRVTFEQAAVGIAHVSPEGRFLRVNKKFCKILGYSREEMLQTTFQEVTYPDDLGLDLKMAGQMLSGEIDTYSIEKRYIHKGGALVWVSLTVALVRDESGRPNWFVSVVREIGDRKEAEEALKASEEMLRSIFVSTPDSITVADLDGRIRLCNESTARIHGFASAEQMIGRSLSELVAEEDHHRMMEARVHVMAHGLARDISFTGLKSSGERFAGELSFSALKDGSGKPIGFVGVTRDVTARKVAEQELSQRRNELAHVARVATMGQLAASIAHELNQPLGAILRNTETAEILLASPSPDLEELRAILVDIHKDDQRAGAVIDGMRALLKHREPERSRLDLGAVAREVASLVRSDAERRGVRLAVESDEGLPSVQGDRVQLQQVLLNLMLNAMDAIDESPSARRVITVRMQTAGTTVEVVVSDQGRGIPVDALPRVFEPFFTSKPNGLGMGLSIAKGIAEAHGGRLSAENNPSGGATFRLVLPATGGSAFDLPLA